MVYEKTIRLLTVQAATEKVDPKIPKDSLFVVISSDSSVLRVAKGVLLYQTVSCA